MRTNHDLEHAGELRAEHPGETREARDDAPTGPQTISGTFRRVRRGPSVRFQKPKDPPAEEPAVYPIAAEPRPARVAIMLALAHKLQRMLDDGHVPSQAEIAKMLGVTPARVTQLLDLTLLAPDVQASVLDRRTNNTRGAPCERDLREVVRAETWGDQRALWKRFLVADLCGW